MVRRIGIVTTSRADYGILRPVIEAIEAHERLSAELLVTGTHLLPSHGLTVAEIEADGHTIAARIEALTGDTNAAEVAAACGRTILGFANVYASCKIDILLVLGDRYELFSAAAAAVPFNIPIAHIHGGELSFGANDESYRHAITKMAHLHFAATPVYARRIAQMGEEDWRIVISGAPALDTIIAGKMLSREEIEARFDVSLAERPSLVTYHPVTREPKLVGVHLQALHDVLMALDHPLIMTGSNADAGGAECAAMLKIVAASRRDATYVESFGSSAYFGVLQHVGCMIGNSSSGIIEAASFSLPVVNIGKRQEGRDQAANVINVETRSDSILAAIKTARSPAFRASITGLRNPYGDGRAGPSIANRLASVTIDERLLVKSFVDRNGSHGEPRYVHS